MVTKSGLQWSSRVVFLMATIGSAVGLGNIWRFSYAAGSSGGGAFVVVYLAAALFSSLASFDCRIDDRAVAALKALPMLLQMLQLSLDTVKTGDGWGLFLEE